MGIHELQLAVILIFAIFNLSCLTHVCRALRGQFVNDWNTKEPLMHLHQVIE
jgi:hypothetical protein